MHGMGTGLNCCVLLVVVGAAGTSNIPPAVVVVLGGVAAARVSICARRPVEDELVRVQIEQHDHALEPGLAAAVAGVALIGDAGDDVAGGGGGHRVLQVVTRPSSHGASYLST